MRSLPSSRVNLAARILDGMRLGLTLWRVQLLIFLNQTVRSRRAGRIAGFVLGVVLILFWWVNVGAIALVTVTSRPRPALTFPLTNVLVLAFLVYMGVLLFSSLLFSVNALLLNPDLDLLLAAPRPVESVLAARMMVQVLRMLVLSLLLTLPALVILTFTANPASLLGFVLLFILYPVIPVVLVSVITLALVRFVPAGRGKEVVALLGIAIGLSINVVNFLVNPALHGPGFHVPIDATTPGIVTDPFLPWSWAGRAAAGLLTGNLTAVWWSLALLVASAGVFVVGVLVSGRVYRAGWIQTVPPRRRGPAAVRRREWSAPPGIDPVLAAIVTKDWRMRTRDMAQLVRFVMPVGFLLLLLGLRGGGLISAVRADGPGPLTALAGLVPAWVLLLSLSGGLGLSAVSLEGKAIWIYAASPNPIGRLLYAKCWASALPTVIATVLVAVLMEALIHPGWLWGTSAVAILAVQAATVTALMVAIGGFWARFDWTDARRMMHPAAGIIGFLAQLGITGATALLAGGSVVLAGLLHTQLAPTFLGALLLAAFGAGVLAYGGLVLSADRLRYLEVV